MNKNILFIGHRGTRKRYDENTLGAFRKAIKYGAEIIELDCHKTKDNKIIVIHDDRLDRTTNGFGFVKDLSYSQIKQFKTLQKKEEIPTLQKTIKELKSQVKFIIELKNSRILEKILKIISKQSKSENFIISSRDIDILMEIHNKNKKIDLCYNITKAKKFSIHDFMNIRKLSNLPLKLHMINLRANLISREFIKKCKDYNIISLAWDFLGYKDPIKKQKELIKMGIEGILFDNFQNIRIIKNWVYNYS
jgi:glycerophosphoryl diester phosphodiesterase